MHDIKIRTTAFFVFALTHIPALANTQSDFCSEKLPTQHIKSPSLQGNSDINLDLSKNNLGKLEEPEITVLTQILKVTHANTLNLSLNTLFNWNKKLPGLCPGY